MMTNAHSSLSDAKDFGPTSSHLSKGTALQVPAATNDSSNSWEENDSDEELYSAGAYTYGHDDDEDDEDDSEDDKDEDNKPAIQAHTILENGAAKKDQEDNINSSHSAKTFDQDDKDATEGLVSNVNMFRASAASRLSVNSGKSYSSHTKHHSFGYDKDRPEPSDSESESRSESDSDEETSFVNAPSSPPVGAASPTPATASTAPGPPPPVSLRSRPPSTAFSTRSKASSPISTRYTDRSPESDKNEVKNVSSEPFTASSSKPSSPIVTRSTPRPPRPISSSSASSFSAVPLNDPPGAAGSTDPLDRRVSGSESDISNTSNDNRSQSIIGHVGSNRAFSSHRLSGGGGRYSQQLQRGSSFSDMSDAELNEVALDSRPSTPKRNSNTVMTPKSAAPPSASAGFPSSFFGGRPHPKSQQYQAGGAPSPGTSPSVAPVSTSSDACGSPVVAPVPTSAGVLNGSFSSLASTIQGAFRFGSSSSSSSSAALPPPPVAISRSNSRTSTRVLGINTSSIGFEVRSSNNVSPERASTYSTMTTDSNMDLLLARLDAQNSLLETDAKRRMTQDLEMDRAIGHAKEESVGEEVDWDYWGALMHDYNGMAKKDPKRLTLMIQKGIPPSLRGLIWQVLAKSKDPELEAKYAELLHATSAHEKQINRDMNRTFPNHEYFQAEGLGQESLFNVVKAYSLYDTEVGYCQGLSFVVGPLLLNNMPDEEAFCVLVKLMNSYDMRGHFTPDMSTLQLRLYQFEQLVEETVPLVYKHFQLQGIKSTMYASQWFMTLFAYKFPLDLVFRIYDILLVEGVDSLLRFAVALLKANHDRIIAHEFETLVEFLKNGLFEQYKNNPSVFVQDAYNVKVTPKKLTQYTQKYNAMLQRQQAELAAEESLKEANKLLSNDVRRLEGSLNQANKEHVELAKELITRKMEMAQLQDKNDVLTQKVLDLTKIVDSQAKEVEDRYKAEIQALMDKNMELIKKNEQMEGQCGHLENLLIDTKMKYAESENQKDALTRKLADLRKALSG